MASDKIQKAVDRFVEEIQQIVADEARETLMSILGGEQPTRRASAPKRGGTRASTPAAAPSRKKGKRVRRSAEDLVAVQEKIVAVLKKQPGVNSEELQDALGMSKQDVQRPLTLLREEGKVKTEGQKRAMRYYPKGRG